MPVPIRFPIQSLVCSVNRYLSNFLTTRNPNRTAMWPILMQFLRSRAPYVTLPFAALIGTIGYHLEGYLSDRYTPYNKAIADQRIERLDEELSKDPTNVEKLKYKENVLGKNLSPSLQK